MWERFSYYGMRALLVLFLVDRVRGGFGLDDKVATAIYGLYTASAYLATLPGGWIADRILGAQRSIWYGGIIIACGHLTMAFNRVETFYLGLMLIVFGTGLLKPNISAIVGDLYPEGGVRRDAGFTLFYMGINLGAALGPIICGALAQHVHWRAGFGAAGVGMILGLVQFHFTKRHLHGAGLKAPTIEPLSGRTKTILLGVAALWVVFLGLLFAGVIHLDPPTLARWLRNFLYFAALVYFASVFIFGRLESDEKRRVGLIILLFVAATIFWAGFEQVGSSFNLFAERYTNRNLFGNILPAAAFQSLGPIFIISLAPIAAAVWLRLARFNLSIPTKFGLGLVILALGFVVMAVAAKLAVGHLVGPSWLVATYFIHTVGELCLSPVGLSSVTKLSPKRLVGQMMGVWFLAASLGNLLAGLLAGEMKFDQAAQMSGQFLRIGILPACAGLALIIFARPIRRYLADVK